MTQQEKIIKIYNEAKVLLYLTLLLSFTGWGLGVYEGNLEFYLVITVPALVGVFVYFAKTYARVRRTQKGGE